MILYYFIKSDNIEKGLKIPKIHIIIRKIAGQTKQWTKEKKDRMTNNDAQNIHIKLYI